MSKQNNSLDLEIAQALALLIYTSTWEKTRKVLEDQQSVLLLDRALELLGFMVVELYQKGDIDDAKNVAQYQELLARARVLGVALAWQNFSPL